MRSMNLGVGSPVGRAQPALLMLFWFHRMAEQYQQEPDKVTATILLSNLAALLFVPLGLWLDFR
jgi:hypothetical protein